VSTVIWECYGLKVPITTHIEIEPPFWGIKRVES
jgi:hypothetical protein